MAKFKAKNDTYYNFSYIKKGTVIDAPDSLRSSLNFECLTPAPVDTGVQAVDGNADNTGASPKDMAVENMPYPQLCALGSSLGIKVGNIKKPDLIAAIKEKLNNEAQPLDDESKNDAGGDRTGTDNQ